MWGTGKFMFDKDFFDKMKEFPNYFNMKSEKSYGVGDSVELLDASGKVVDNGVITKVGDDDLVEVEIRKVVTVRRSDIR